MVPVTPRPMALPVALFELSFRNGMGLHVSVADLVEGERRRVVAESGWCFDLGEGKWISPRYVARIEVAKANVIAPRTNCVNRELASRRNIEVPNRMLSWSI